MSENLPHPEVVPADDDDLAVVEGTNVPVRYQRDWNNWFVSCLVARVRQEQAALLETNGWLRDAERERDEALARVRQELARAEKAEAEAEALRFMVDDLRMKKWSSEQAAAEQQAEAERWRRRAEKAEAALKESGYLVEEMRELNEQLSLCLRLQRRGAEEAA